MKRRDFLRLAALCGGATALDWISAAKMTHAKDIYPARKITWISDTMPGGAHDMLPRAMSPYLNKYLEKYAPGCRGGGIVMKNEPAAGGVKALTTIFRAAPDGYTIGGMDSSFIMGPMAKKVDFDLTKYTYLARLSSTSKVVIANKTSFKTWDEAVKASQKAPLKIATGKFGGQNHLAGILLKEALNLNVRFISTQGTSGSVSMLLRDDVHLAITSDDAISGLLKSKEMQVLLAFKDADEYPGSVSLKAMGHTEYSDLSSGHRFAIAPPGLPNEITNLLIKAIKGALEDEEFKAWAKQTDYALTPIYGNDALQLIKSYVEIFHHKEDLLTKYLQ